MRVGRLPAKHAKKRESLEERTGCIGFSLPSHTICCDPGAPGRPQRVPIPAGRDRPPDCDKALIHSKLRDLATMCVKCPG